jgi:hypothetical protein
MFTYADVIVLLLPLQLLREDELALALHDYVDKDEKVCG